MKRPQTFAIEDVLKWAPLEERIYRFRCVEGWSMVVPWIGFSFSEIARRVEITGNAKYVEFVRSADAEQMPYVARTAARLALWSRDCASTKAMHPLTLLAVGLYGEVMPKQNGAPLRLIVPWKYGFKSAKAIVKRSARADKCRVTTWMKSAPQNMVLFERQSRGGHPAGARRRTAPRRIPQAQDPSRSTATPNRSPRSMPA